MNNLEVITLTKLNLEEAVADNKFWGDSYEAPFSMNKAKWMLANNRAEDHDVLAILGYENHSIIAFVYIVPDYISETEGSRKKIFWSQKWWVSEKYQGSVLPAYVKNMSLNACNNQVIVRFLGDNTSAYYEKQPFTKFSIRKRYIILFNLDYQLLVSKKNSLKNMTPILKLADGLSREMIAFINRIKCKKISHSINYEGVEFVDDGTWSFIEKYTQNDVVPKSKDYINWQIDNRQYLQIKNKSNKIVHKCLLESVSNKIYNVNFVVKKNHEIVGFISGFVSGKRFTLRYFITSESYFNDCLKILMKNITSNKCTLLQTENSKVGNQIISKFTKVYADVKELISLKHNDVSVKLDNSLITDQDGNFV
jgi:hypothetical protein